MAGLSIIGRIGVRVYPDLTGFKQRLRAQLKELEKELDDVKVGIKFDKDRMARDAQRALDEIELSTEAKIKADSTDFDELGRAIDDVDRRLKDLGRETFDFENTEEGLRNLRDRLSDLQDESKIRLEFVDDLDGWKRAEQEILRRIRQFEPVINLEIDADREALEETLASVRQRIADEELELKIEAHEEGIDKIRRKVDELLAKPGYDVIDVRESQASLNEIQRHIRELEKIGIEVDADTRQAEKDLAHFLALQEDRQFNLKVKLAEEREAERQAQDLARAYERAWNDWYRQWAQVERTLRMRLDMDKSQAEALIERFKAEYDGDEVGLELRIRNMIQAKADAERMAKDAADAAKKAWDDQLKQWGDWDAAWEKAFTDAVRRQTEAVEQARAEWDKHYKFFRLEMGLDDEKARREADKFFDKYNGKEIEAQLAVDSLLARAEMARVTRDRIVTLHVNVSKKSLAAAATAIAALSGARMAGDTVRRLWESLEDLDKAIPAISAVTTAILLLSAALTTAVSNTLALFSSLVQIGALALTLPGIATGFAVGFGATFAVFKDFNEVLPEVKERLADLQDRMSERFWRKAKNPIRNFIDTLFPEFEEGMLGVTDSLGDFFGELANHLREDLGGRMGGMFENLSESIDIATGAADALSGIITTLGEKGSEYLPRLAEWFKRNMISFDQWIEEAAQSGEFDRWIERAIENAGYLWAAVRDLSVIIYTLGVNAEEAGGSGLKQFAETMARVRDVVQSPGFLTKYREFVQASHDFIQSISDGVDGRFVDFVPGFVDDLIYAMEQMGPAIGDVWGSIFEGLSTEGFREGFRGLFDGLADGFEKLAPHIPGIVEGIGTLLGLIGTMADQFLPIWGEVLELIADILKENAPVIEELIIALSDAFLELLRNHSDDIKEIFASVLDLAVKIAPYAPYILIAAGGFRLLAGALSLFKPLLPVLRGLGGLSRMKWTGVAGLGRTLSSGRFLRGAGLLGVIVGALFGAWQNSERLRESFWPLAEAVHNLSQRWGELLDWMSKPFFIVLGDSLGVWVEKFTHFTEGLADLMAGDFSGAMEHWSKIADFSFVGELWDKWGDEAEKWWEEKFPSTTGSKVSGEIEKTSRKGIDGFRRGIDEGVPKATREMEQQIRRGLGSVDASGSGRGIAETARRGLSSVPMEPTGRSMGSAVVTGLNQAPAQPGGKRLGGQVVTGVKSVNSTAQSGGRALAAAVLRGISGTNAKSAGRGLAQTALSGLTANTYTKGRSFANDFASGIRASASQQAVRKAVGTIAGIAKGGLPGSPAEWGPLSGSGWSRIRGQHYTDDFAQGIRERRKAVVGAVEDVAKAASLQDKLKNGSRIAANLEMDHQHELRLADAPITLTVDGQQMSGYITQKVDARNAEEARRIRYGRGQ